MIKLNPVTTILMAITSSLIVACSQTQQAQNDPRTTNTPITIPPPAPVSKAPAPQEEADAAAEQLSAVATVMAERKVRTQSLQKKKELARMAPNYSAAKPFSAGMVMQSIRDASEPLDRENYAHVENNRVIRVAENPVSTFSIDVDTGSYSNVRRILNQGRLPVKDAVRVEELVNYFSYNYPLPDNNNQPFRVTTEVGPTPWNTNSKLLHVGIKGFDIDKKNLPASNLVFLLDVSGSMMSDDKLGLLKSSLKLLSKQLRPEDRISIVVYAGASGVVLEGANGSEKSSIIRSLDQLTAGGSTNGAAGIKLAYQLAEQYYIKGGINRVLLATDGDFNVGTVDFESLKNLIEEQRKSGVSLTTLGFGTGNYNDHLMEQLADAGNGNYSYIDTLNEAQKVLVDEMGSTFNTIAKDVKIQIEFNPAVVSEYRLIGYENRKLNREDFNNDKIDAGEIGAGHTVTALYEITLANSQGQRMDDLRYSNTKDSASENKTGHKDEIALLRLRYKAPEGSKSKLIETPVKTASIKQELNSTSKRYQFSAAVAAYAQLLKGGDYTESFNYDSVLKLARQSKGNDPFGYRGEFIQLVNLTNTLSTQDKVAQTRHDIKQRIH